MKSIIFGALLLSTSLLATENIEHQKQTDVFKNILKVHTIVPRVKINWNRPNTLAATAGINSLLKDYAPIGHFAVEVQCEQANEFGVNHILTGMERLSKRESEKITMRERLGLGSLFYNFRGDIQGSLSTLDELHKAKKQRRLTTVSIPVSAERCQKMLEFTKQWIISGSYTVYGGAKDVEYGEGAGCADFALEYFKIATDIEPTKELFAEVRVPKSLIGDGEGKRVHFIKTLVAFRWARENEPHEVYRTPDTNKVLEYILGNSKTKETHYLYLRHLDPTEDIGIWSTDLPIVFKEKLVDLAEQMPPYKQENFEFKYEYETFEEEESVWQRISIDNVNKDDYLRLID